MIKYLKSKTRRCNGIAADTGTYYWFFCLFRLFRVRRLFVVIAAAIAVTIVVPAIVAAAVIVFAVDLFFNVSEIVIKLIDIRFKTCVFIFKIGDGESHILKQTDHFLDKTTGIRGGIKLHAFGKTFDIRSLFVDVHNESSFTELPPAALRQKVENNPLLIIG
jgi:hypothetical protein